MWQRHPLYFGQIRALGVCAVVVASVGCIAGLDDGFACRGDANCGPAERCVDTACAAPDNACTSGFRWDATAGTRATQCTQPPLASDLGVTQDLADDLAHAVDLSDPSDLSDLSTCGNKTTCYKDDFNDGVRAPFWSLSVDDAKILTEAAGKLTATLGDQSAGAVVAGTYETAAQDLSNASVSVAVQTTDASTAAQILLLASSTSLTMRFGIGLQNGVLAAFQVVDGMTTMVIQAVPYDAQLHAWWRIREVAGTLFFETSDGKTTWTTLATLPTPAYADQVMIALGVLADHVAPPAGALLVQFDDYNNLLPLPAM